MQTPSFDGTVDFGRSLSWWSLRQVLGAYRRGGARRIVLIWGAATIVSVFLALLEARLNWSGIPFQIGSWTFGFSFYPPLAIGVLLTIWLGPAFGAATAYLSTLASGLYSGFGFPLAALFALGTPAELILLWFLLLILRVQPHLPRVRDWALFASAGLVATTASSVDIMLYNATLKVALQEGQRLWLGWILGDFAQMMVLVAPLLWLGERQAQGMAMGSIGLPPSRGISTRQILVLLASVWATLGMLVFLGVRLLERALDIPDFAVTVTGDPLVPRLQEMGLFVGVFVMVLLITTMALTAALAGIGNQHREQSFRDELTGCFNRRAFKRLFTREAERSAGLNRAMSIVFFDIDNFKKLNDRFGHETGDSVLAEVARQTTEMLSPQELLFRWGGEEFVVLLSHTGRDAASGFAERLRARIEERVQVDDEDGRESVTISLGVSSADPPDFDEDALIRIADAALYQAKASGKNRVVTDRMMRGTSGADSQPIS